jgi:hypothetical protein
VAKTTTRAAIKPLKQLQQLLPKVTHDELLQLVIAAQAEIGRRAAQYADAVYDLEDPPRDLVNEALSFVTRATGILPVGICAGPQAVKEAWHQLHDAESDLKAALDG